MRWSQIDDTDTKHSIQPQDQHEAVIGSEGKMLQWGFFFALNLALPFVRLLHRRHHLHLAPSPPSCDAEALNAAVTCSADRRWMQRCCSDAPMLQLRVV